MLNNKIKDITIILIIILLYNLINKFGIINTLFTITMIPIILSGIITLILIILFNAKSINIKQKLIGYFLNQLIELVKYGPMVLNYQYLHNSYTYIKNLYNEK